MLITRSAAAPLTRRLRVYPYLRAWQSKAAGGGVPDLSQDVQYSDEDNIVRVIEDEHRRAEFLFRAFMDARDPDDRMILLYGVTKLLSQHAACEELVVYPFLRDRVPGGRDVYERSVKEHRQLKIDLDKADGLTWKDPAFEDVVRAAMNDQLDHAREEEGQVSSHPI